MPRQSPPTLSSSSPTTALGHHRRPWQPLDLTPNFDRMATHGTHVANCFTCQPVCAPARASLQTGLYSTNTGVWRNAIPLPENSHTLAHCFRQAGYATSYIGKWHLAPATSKGQWRRHSAAAMSTGWPQTSSSSPPTPMTP